MRSAFVFLSLSATFVLACPAIARSGAAIPNQSPKDVRPGVPTAPGWLEELPPAIQQAKKTGKDILIDFGGSNWCGPCIYLKKEIFTKPEFYAKASKDFVLVDIDTLTPDAMPKDKLARYIAYQKQYSVGSFPSVFLCTPDGQAYGWTTYVPTIKNPEAYWAHLAPIVERGRLFRNGLEKAAQLKGVAKADAMVEALSEVRSDFIWRYHPEMVKQIGKLDPSDHLGFIAYLEGRKAFDEFCLKLKNVEALKAYEALAAKLKGLQGKAYYDAFLKAGGDRLNVEGIDPKFTVSDVDALVARYKLNGETLQQALIIQAVICTQNDKPADALQYMSNALAAGDNLSPFDKGDYFHFDKEAAQGIQSCVNSCAGKNDKAAMYAALHRIFEHQLPDRYEWSCHGTVDDDFRPNIAVRVPITLFFDKAVQETSASLDGKAKADYAEQMQALMSVDDERIGRYARPSKN